MQYIRSKVFDVFLIICTLVLGLATPLIVIWNNQKVVRTCSIIWAQGIAWGAWHILGLTYRLEGDLPTLDTPKLIVSNHQSMWETIIYATLLRDVSFVAKKELARVPVFGWYLRRFPMVLIDRSSGRLAFNDLLNKASEAIEEGRSILIFPEGTRVQPDEYKKFHFGVAVLYNQLKIPAVTMAHNSGCFWNDEYSMKYSGTITVRVIEEIPPGLPATEFARRIERSINEQKNQLRDSLHEDEWRQAVG